MALGMAIVVINEPTRDEARIFRWRVWATGEREPAEDAARLHTKGDAPAFQDIPSIVEEVMPRSAPLRPALSNLIGCEHGVAALAIA